MFFLTNYIYYAHLTSVGFENYVCHESLLMIEISFKHCRGAQSKLTWDWSNFLNTPISQCMYLTDQKSVADTVRNC